LRRGLNADIGRKDFFEMASKNNQPFIAAAFSCETIIREIKYMAMFEAELNPALNGIDNIV
jgi:hypothetical protein